MKRANKRILSTLAAITCLSASIPQGTLLSLCPALTVSAADTTSDGFSYTVTDDGQGIVITEYTGSATSVIVPDELDGLPVTEIGAWAFFYNHTAVSVKLPDTVTHIGSNAFNGQTQLAEINMPKALTYIGSNAFSSCALTEVILPDQFTEIGSQAFAGCEKLETIEIPESLTIIGGNAFKDTAWMKNKQDSSPLVIVNGILIDGTACINNVIIPETVHSIADMAFSGCRTVKFLYLTNVESIGESAFFGCSSLANITLSHNLTSIGVSAFSNCTALTKIKIPDSVTDIGGSAFFNCKELSSVTLPSGLSTIGNSTFCGCISLPEITLPDSIKKIDVRAFLNCVSLEEITIPDGAESIEYAAFTMCTSLKKIRIPASVTKIGPAAFGNCAKLMFVSTADSYARNYAEDNMIPFCVSGYEDDAQFSGVSLTLQDDLGLNYYLKNIPTDADAEKYSITFSGACDEDGKTIQLSKKKDQYCATANVSADHMDEKIIATIKKENTVIGSYSYSVNQYLSSVDTSDSNALAALVQTTKTYGAVSKAYFNTPENMPVVTDYSSEYSTAEFEPKKGSTDMISLVLDSKLAARLYVDGLTASGTATCGDKTLKAKKSGSGEYYFEVTGISPTKLATDIIIQYNEKTYTFKPLSWCYLVNRNNVGGKNQVMADVLYEYYSMAVAYNNTL